MAVKLGCSFVRTSPAVFARSRDTDMHKHEDITNIVIVWRLTNLSCKMNCAVISYCAGMIPNVACGMGKRVSRESNMKDIR